MPCKGQMGEGHNSVATASTLHRLVMLHKIRTKVNTDLLSGRIESNNYLSIFRHITILFFN